MNFTRFGFILILFWFNVSYADDNETDLDDFTQEKDEILLETVVEILTTIKESGTKLNDTKSHKAAVQLLVKLSHVLETPKKEDFVTQYFFVEKNLSPFLDQSINLQFSKIKEMSFLDKIYKDKHTKREKAVLQLIQSEQYRQNIPSVDEVEELMDTIEKVDITKDESYDEYPILKTKPEHLLRSIILFFLLIKNGAPVIQNTWNRDINITDPQWTWLAQSKDQSHVKSIFNEIDEVIDKPANHDNVTEEIHRVVDEF